MKCTFYLFVWSELLIFGELEGCVTTLTPSFQRCSTLRRLMDLCQCPCLVLLQGGDCDDCCDDCDGDVDEPVPLPVVPSPATR